MGEPWERKCRESAVSAQWESGMQKVCGQGCVGGSESYGAKNRTQVV